MIEIEVTADPASRITIAPVEASPIVGHVDQTFTCRATTSIPGYEHLIQWSNDGNPAYGFGPVFQARYTTIGTHDLKVGPSSKIAFEIYKVTAITHDSEFGPAVWYGFPVTFSAIADPPRYSEVIPWWVDTMNDMHTHADPAGATGATFTTTFANPSDDGLFWAQVHAGNLEAFASADMGCPTPTVVITSPHAGSTLSTYQLATIEATLLPPFDDPARIANVEVFATSPSQVVIPIASGGLRSTSIPGLIAFWDLEGVASGTYPVTVRATPVGCGSPGQATVTVNVNQAPTVTDIQVLSCISVPSSCGGSGSCVSFPNTPCMSAADCVGRNVSMNAIASDSDGDNIVEFVWDPGIDLQPVVVSGTSSFAATYPPGTTIAIVAVTAHDTGGGADMALRDVNVQDLCMPQESQDCGCKEMKINSGAGMSGIYCSPKDGGAPTLRGCVEVPAPPAGEGCPVGSTAFQCSTGPLDPIEGAITFAWNFEVAVKLTENTNAPSRCEEGQFAQITVTRDGQVVESIATTVPPQIPAGGVLNLPGRNFNVVGGEGVPIPMFGQPQLGADDYSKERDFKRHLPRAIRWFDSPKVPTIPSRPASYQARFLTFVRGTGNKPTCWCYFELNHSWAANGPRTGPAQVVRLDGLNCPP